MKVFSLLFFLFTGHAAAAQFFTKVTDSPISTTQGDSRSVNWVDVNGDGYVDFFISNGPAAGQNNMLYMNDGLGGFIAVTDDPIVMEAMPSVGATFADIDNDGDLDGFVVNWYNKHNMAYLNHGDGSFTRVTEGIWVGNSGYSETAAFGDYNHDGLVDLYVTNSAGISKNFMYKNVGNQTFMKVGEGAPANDIAASRNASWVDIDNDNDLDLFVTNENAEKDQLYRNDNGSSFESLIDIAITTDRFNTMSSSWGDIDNDGDLDLFLATDGGKNRLYRNDGNFVFTPLLDTDISTNNTKSFSSAFADIDNDGDLDLFVTNAFMNGVRLKNLMYLNDGTGHFTEVTEDMTTMDTGWSYGCAFGDYDNDGFQDLAVATTRFGTTDDVDYLYHNTGNQNHWLTLSLVGTVSNRSAIGAKVRIKATINNKPVWQMREVSAQSGYCSQNDMRAHFGVGQALNVDSVRIEWPSGIVQFLSAVQVDQILTIEEKMVSSTSTPLDQIDFKVYPNPTDSYIHLKASFTRQVDVLHLEIVGDTGQLVYHESFQHVDAMWTHEINLRRLQLSPGVYYLKLHSGLSSMERKIVLIR